MDELLWAGAVGILAGAIVLIAFHVGVYRCAFGEWPWV